MNPFLSAKLSVCKSQGNWRTQPVNTNVVDHKQLRPVITRGGQLFYPLPLAFSEILVKALWARFNSSPCHVWPPGPQFCPPLVLPGVTPVSPLVCLAVRQRHQWKWAGLQVVDQDRAKGYKSEWADSL